MDPPLRLDLELLALEVVDALAGRELDAVDDPADLVLVALVRAAPSERLDRGGLCRVAAGWTSGTSPSAWIQYIAVPFWVSTASTLQPFAVAGLQPFAFGEVAVASQTTHLYLDTSMPFRSAGSITTSSSWETVQWWIAVVHL